MDDKNGGDNSNGIVKEEDLSSLGELAAVDSLLEDAATAIDEGKYQDALDGFEQALELTKRIFGDNIELTELKHKIADIQKLLAEQNSKSEE